MLEKMDAFSQKEKRIPHPCKQTVGDDGPCIVLI